MQLRYLMDFYRDKKKSWGVEDIFGETYYVWQILFLDLSEVFPYCTLPLQSLISWVRGRHGDSIRCTSIEKPACWSPEVVSGLVLGTCNTQGTSTEIVFWHKSKMITVPSRWELLRAAWMISQRWSHACCVGFEVEGRVGLMFSQWRCTCGTVVPVPVHGVLWLSWEASRSYPIEGLHKYPPCNLKLFSPKMVSAYCWMLMTCCQALLLTVLSVFQ